MTRRTHELVSCYVAVKVDVMMIMVRPSCNCNPMVKTITLLVNMVVVFGVKGPWIGHEHQLFWMVYFRFQWYA